MKISKNCLVEGTARMARDLKDARNLWEQLRLTYSLMRFSFLRKR